MANNNIVREYRATATVVVGQFQSTTPEVISVNVSRMRGQLVGTASASFYAKSDATTPSGGDKMQIYIAGALVFTGTAKRISISPSNICAGEIVIRVQGEDYLHRLANRQITRRQKLAGLGPLAMITGVQKRTSVNFDDAPGRYDISHSSSPIDIFSPSVNFRDWTQLLTDNSNSSIGKLHPITSVVEEDYLHAKGTGGGGGFILHSHESLDLSGPQAGGPARAVYGIK